MKARNLLLTGAMLGVLGAAPVQATIIGFSADLSSAGSAAAIIAPPAQVLNSLAFNTGQQGFDEKQGVLLLAPLAVDGGSIAAGTVVDSHMIFLNKQDGVPGTLSHTVTWTFGGTILGVMSNRTGSLEVLSSALLGAAGTIYPAAPFLNRGLEGADHYDVLGSQLELNLRVSQPGDWVRVVTAAAPIPEPGVLLLLGTGLMSLALFRRRKR